MGHRVLLVDHGSGAAERLCEPLVQAGHEAMRVAGIVEAMTAVARARPDLVVIDDGGAEATTAALCARLKGSDLERGIPVIVLADHVSRVVDEPSERARRIGCDRVLDSNLPGDELVMICAELLARASSTARNIAAPVGQPDSVTKETNRDAPSAESFAVSMESPLVGSSHTEDDGGQDIEAHLDSLFAPASKVASRPVPLPPTVSPTAPRPGTGARSGPGSAAPSQAAPRRIPPTAPRPAPPAPAPRASAATSPSAGGRSAPLPAPRRATPPATLRAERPAPPTAPRPEPPVVRAFATAGDPPPAVPASTSTVREAPKALMQLRQPRVATPRPAEPEPPNRLRWIGLAAGVTVVGAAALWFVFFTGGSDAPATEPASPVVARVEAPVAPVPAPVPVAAAAAESPALPAPPPLSLSTTEIDFAAPTIPMIPAPEPSAEAAKPVRKPTKAAVHAAVAPEETNERTAPPAVRPVPIPAARDIPPLAESAPAPPKAAPAQVAPEVARATPPQAPESQPPSSGPAEVQTASAAAALPAPAPVEPPVSSPAEPPAVEAVPEPAPAAPVVVPPGVLERVAPVYSPAALKKVDKPVVVLRVLVDEQGRIGRVVVEQGIPGSELEAAAISAVLRWRFSPGTENGVPVKAWTSARFVFER